jgi:transposase InsO family protein
VKTVADTLGVARSHLHDRLRRPAPVRGAYRKTDDEVLMPLIRRLVEARPTYGYRRITALLNRKLAAEAKAAANHKRVFRIMKREGLLLTRHTGRRKGHLHDGKVVVMRSNLRWCSDAFEVKCWNGEIVRIVFAIDAHDREVLAWHAVAGAGISGSMVRDLMLEAVERRFDAIQAPHSIEWLSENGSPYTANETIDFAAALGLVPLLHPGPKPGVERHRRGLRQNLQARLCSREPFARRPYRAPADRRVVPRLQREPPSLRAGNALPKGIHPSSGSIAGCPAKRGQLHWPSQRDSGIST